jgi:hypothetical protein
MNEIKIYNTTLSRHDIEQKLDLYKQLGLDLKNKVVKPSAVKIGGRLLSQNLVTQQVAICETLLQVMEEN